QARTGALQEARGTFETVLGQSPNNLDALIGLADVSLRQGDAAGAEKAMGRALAQRPKDLVLLKNFANLYLAVGKPDQAVARLEQAQQADPANQALVRLLAAVYTSAGQPLDALRLLADKGDAKDPAVQTQQGEAELRAGRNEAAEKTFRAVADAAPAAAAYVNLGRALEAEGQLVPAADAFKKALALEPANASAALGVARVELLGLTAPVDPVRAKRAMDAVAKTLQQYPSGPESARLRAAVGLVTGQAPASRKVLQSLYDAAPGAESVTDLATACRLTGDTKGAITLLRTHLERYPKDLSVRLTLARYLMAERQPAAAVTELAKLVEQDWGNIDAHTDLAAALIQAGRAAEARTHAAAAAKARPDDERVKALVKAAK
ncbi:MAG TPA: tetratricopeptide repeat protein, partial [Lamprocystis sp. (in: g-proteobacteria)]|nr:tetratricopeptide repeat protein [Lamprocystis sp. (in: g-proteobacteria)]